MNINNSPISFSASLLTQQQKKYQTAPKQYQKPSLLVAMEKNKKQKETKNLKIILASLISAGVVIFGVVKTKNVLKLKKAAQKEAEIAAQKAKEKSEKLAQEAKDRAERLAKEAKEKAQKEADRTARAEADKVAQQEKKRLAEEAQKKAEQEVRIKAEQEAQIAAQNLKTNSLKELQEGLRQKISMTPYNENLDYGKQQELIKAVFTKSVEDFGDEIVQSIKKAEQSGLNQQEIIKEVKSALNISDEAIETISQSFMPSSGFAEGLTTFNAKNQLKERQALVKDLEKLKNNNVKKDNESLSDYFTRLLKIRKQNQKDQKLHHIETLKQKLSYSEKELAEEKIVLTPEEVEELRKSLKNSFTGNEKGYLAATEEQLKKVWLRELSNDMGTSIVSKRIERACFQKLNQYDSSLKDLYKDNTFAHEPLYRWMAVNNVDAFVEKNFTPGGRYTLTRKQSCSKNKTFAETYFHDDNISMNFKFIIHPKSKVSKAYDINIGHYGSNEAVYSTGQEFTIIDRRIEEFVISNPENNYGRKSLFRWIVEMQEV